MKVQLEILSAFLNHEMADWESDQTVTYSEVYEYSGGVFVTVDFSGVWNAEMRFRIQGEQLSVLMHPDGDWQACDHTDASVRTFWIAMCAARD